MESSSSSSTSQSTAEGHEGTARQLVHSRTCIQCNQAESKYTCPACSVRTCSLGCSNQHKLDRKCSGKRNRVEYVQLNHYSWGRLMQDYSYLEEIHRHLSHPPHSQSANPSSNTKPPALQDLHAKRNAASKRDFLIRKAALEGVGLTLMPDGMSRRKMNMTNFNQKKKCIQWSVELVFPGGEQDTRGPQQSESNGLTPNPSSCHLIHQISSDTKMMDVLKRTLKLKKLKLSQERRSLLSNLIEEQEEEDNLMFIMRIEPVTRSETDLPQPRLHAEVHVIDSSCTTLSEALNGMKLVEWPKIEVWTAAEWTTEISSGRVRIVPKPTLLPKFQRPVDSGWPAAKRPRIDAPDPPSPESDHHPSQSLVHESKSAADDPVKPSLTSLLQYSSSEDEAD
ncbi:hypothetical protein PCANC_11816 [Puccinia coronata f. sp. avenae]|uniref:HIT-type domain-containing protein n=1 Tax=Puccinia coronata f. sp. avenae TaxID=200324 RepID=A0A2N5SR43_9BASI|nr:hypothetical protein PCASD_22173 [Puccinia coronata f. sp. avenae]PLW18969.1 hypothetical protein PCANC_11816 [Puccinia coronata f. sp. avenae]PLW50858.1 hypothetical protein PCASD_01118 [Puccinia coronata f. sp. avenae]